MSENVVSPHMIYIVGDGHKELTMVAKVRTTLKDEGTAKGT